MVTSTALSAAKISGGSFLIEDRTPDEVFTPEDFTEQHLLIAQTAEEFAIKEIVPNAEKMEHKDFSVSRELVRKAGELGLSGVDIPEQYGGMQLDKVTSAIVADRLAKYTPASAQHGALTPASEHYPSFTSGPKTRRKNISPAWLMARRSVPTHFQNHLRDLTPSIAAPGPHSPPTANAIS